MKSIVTIVAASLLAGAFAVSADAAAKSAGQEEILGHPFPQAPRLREELHASEGLGAVYKVARRRPLRIAAIRSAAPRRHDRV